MKTSLEIQDVVFRRAKSIAAEQGMSLRQFVTEAVEDNLKAIRGDSQKPWMKHVGKLKDLHKETQRINAVKKRLRLSIDVWIAALCRQHDLPLLSRDRHFDQVTGIKRLEW